MDYYAFAHSIRPLLTASCSTLRKLRLNIEVLLDLDYSQFPLLQTLQFGASEHEEDFPGPLPSSTSSRFERFFDSLAKVPNLDTFEFESETFKSAYEEELFPDPHNYNALRQPKRPLLKGLRFIRFGEDISLNRVVRLVKQSWTANVEKISVPPADAEGDDEYDLIIAGLRGILARRRIELVFDSDLVG
ncbi:uncharacterized protein JCM6883_000809 [Sporobolomyces salmoneus]|uniref:uncharacterized protein n=1 Tax=Sporobolomyces salmoneus TaxID=183962 RepID=UPI00316B7EE9